jgi:hypothetical protein
MKYFQATLRDLFWLMLVVAMGLAWWADRARHQTRARMHEQQIADLQRQVNELPRMHIASFRLTADAPVFDRPEREGPGANRKNGRNAFSIDSCMVSEAYTLSCGPARLWCIPL